MSGLLDDNSWFIITVAVLIIVGAFNRLGTPLLASYLGIPEKTAKTYVVILTAALFGIFLLVRWSSRFGG